MNDLRLLFHQDNEHFSVHVEPNGTPLPFSNFLEESDFENLRWYLEDYLDLPDGGSVIRAEKIERSLHDWGRRLYKSVFGDANNWQRLQQLQQCGGPKTLTIATGFTEILRLPWELLADDAGFLALQGIVIRRQLEQAQQAQQRVTKLPLRLLLVVSRPADLGFIDPRLTSAALLDALKPLGAHVNVEFCRPPTLARLQAMLNEAERSLAPFDIVHFDGHGTFLPEEGIGALCFEQDQATLDESATDRVSADTLGNLFAAHRIPLVILEACRSGQIGKLALFRAVAPRLIQAGVGSVISMGHAVHVEAARILLECFYQEMVVGATVGAAIAQGRAALLARPARWIEMGAGGRKIALQDWFLPHLYQRGADQPMLPPAPPPPDRYDVFLSHTHADSARVEGIAQMLVNNHGLRVWLDKWEMQPGSIYDQCAMGVEKSRLVLLACTKKALESEWVHAEIDWAGANDVRGRNLIPLIFEEAPLPTKIKGLMHVDFTNPTLDAQQTQEVARLVGKPLAGVTFRKVSRIPANIGETGAFPRRPRYGFQGRAKELYELERQFRRHRAILLHAMGGMGKTSLATEAAQWWTRTGLFPDGACFISFEQFASAERIAQVLGEYLEGVSFNSLPADEQLRRAKALFQDKRVLMVWDNFESALPQFNHGAPASCRQDAGAPSQYSADERHRILDLFQDWTENPKGLGRLLITCRPQEPSLGAARQTELRGLARHDSLSLLVQVLETVGVEFHDSRLNRDTLAPLLDLLADHPLSIELVGPHLKHLTPAQIIAEFETLLPQFTGDAEQERNRSLLASLAFSTRRLSAAAQAVLPWLGWFTGGVFEQVLLDISGIPPAQWEPLRAELEATALLRVEREVLLNDRPYLRFHPTLVYAIGKANQPDAAWETALVLRQRYLQVYDAVREALAQALRGSQSRWALEVLAREEVNYRTAVQYALADQDYNIAGELGYTFRTYLEMSGRLRERNAWVAWLFDAIGKAGFSEHAANYVQEQAWSLFTQGQPQAALDKLQALIERLRHTTEFDPAFQLAFAQTILGRLLDACGFSGPAIPVLREAITQWESLVETVGSESWATLITQSERDQAASELANLSMTLFDLANALLNAGQLDQALEQAELALKIDAQLGRDRDVAAGHGQCAQILSLQGRTTEADQRYGLALSAARRAGDKTLEASLLQHQGCLANDLGQLDRANRLCQNALKIFQAMNNDGSIMQACNLLGVVQQKSGRLAEARAWYQRSRELAQRLDDKPALGQAAQNIGIVCQQEGEAARQQGDETTAQQHFAQAKRFIQESLRLTQQRGNEPAVASSLAQLAKVLRLLGDYTEAERHAHLAREIMERLGMKEVYMLYNDLADICRAQGQTEAAADWQRKSDAARAELHTRAGG